MVRCVRSLIFFFNFSKKLIENITYTAQLNKITVTWRLHDYTEMSESEIMFIWGSFIQTVLYPNIFTTMEKWIYWSKSTKACACSQKAVRGELSLLALRYSTLVTSRKIWRNQDGGGFECWVFYSAWRCVRFEKRKHADLVYLTCVLNSYVTWKQLTLNFQFTVYMHIFRIPSDLEVIS